MAVGLRGSVRAAGDCCTTRVHVLVAVALPQEGGTLPMRSCSFRQITLPAQCGTHTCCTRATFRAYLPNAGVDFHRLPGHDLAPLHAVHPCLGAAVHLLLHTCPHAQAHPCEKTDTALMSSMPTFSLPAHRHAERPDCDVGCYT
jgi:hypothetical protein